MGGKKKPDPGAEDVAVKRQKLVSDKKYAAKGLASESLFFEDRTGMDDQALGPDVATDSEDSLSDVGKVGISNSSDGIEDDDRDSSGSDSDRETDGEDRAVMTVEQLKKKGLLLCLAAADATADATQRSQPAGPSGRNHSQTRATQRQPVWHDDDVAALAINVASVNRLRKLRASEAQSEVTGGEYEQALRKQHQSLNPRTAWAAKSSKHRRRRNEDGDSEDDADRPDAEELLMTAGGLLSRKAGSALPAGTLEATRVKDGNAMEPGNAVLQSTRFHPNGQLLLTAGLDKRLRFFQVDGVNNPKLQSVFLQDMPVHGAEFASGGDQVIAVGRRPFFYVYDLHAARVERVTSLAGLGQKSLESCVVTTGAAAPGGGGGSSLAAFLCDSGQIALASLASRQLVGMLKMNGTVRCAAFTADGNQLVSSGSDGIVYTWDVRMQRCLSQLVDEGNTNATSLAVSADGQYLATGAASGVVNIHRRDVASTGAGPSFAKPLKSIMNLTTTIDTLRFSPDSQMLAIASRLKRDALRLLHLPTLSVFSNWPTTRSPLHYVHSLDFSPHCGFLAVGNAKGRALLYRLHHYADA